LINSNTETLRATKSKGAKSQEEKPRPIGGKQDAIYLEIHELLPVSNPKHEVTKLLGNLRNSEWEIAFEALNMVRRLAFHHSTYLEDKLHSITKEILNQVPNLRSSVSKNACLALDSMCTTFRKSMDPEVDTIIPILIKRCGDSNQFVCESASSSINAVVLNCSTSKVLNALAVHLSSKAIPVRREVARATYVLIASQKEEIQMHKDLDRMLQIVGKCLDDSNNEVRDLAKQSIMYLFYEQRFDAQRLKRMLPASTHSKMDSVLSGKEKYKPQLLPTNPSSVTSKAVVSSAGATSAPKEKHSNAKDVESASGSSTAPNIKPTSSKSNSFTSVGSTLDVEALGVIQKKLDSNNWKDRFDALQETSDFVLKNANSLVKSGKIIGLFDVILKRMEDGNSKVNVLCLESLEKIIPALGNGMEQVLSNFVPALAKNLAASNAKVSYL
jgi:hypothetical protein